MLRIGAAQCYLDPLIAGINDVQELSKTHEAIAKAKTEIQHRETPLGRWARGRLARAHKNVAVVALANKLVRIAWAILARGCAYNAGYEMVSA